VTVSPLFHPLLAVTVTEPVPGPDGTAIEDTPTVRLAAAPVPLPPEKATVGIAVYPEPAAVMVNPTSPRVAVRFAFVAPPVAVTVGGVVYPVPGLVRVIEPTPSDAVAEAAPPLTVPLKLTVGTEV
jgi:hypothetical protein